MILPAWKTKDFAAKRIFLISGSKPGNGIRLSAMLVFSKNRARFLFPMPHEGISVFWTKAGELFEQTMSSHGSSLAKT
ncbi:hypothetical protein WM40_26175 [Robbsia andropogonis]|uniref:Uncharacterized protein n=1 Tax=Robbsia andropogonis TaxID=28092 RepID=A0A0F5JTG4_9BURK|nr:hypothetical protein WM40_26175 [Robbsia andropogonis]